MTAHDMDEIALQLPDTTIWADRPAATELATLPSGGVVALLLDATGQPVQLLTTQSLRRWSQTRLVASEPGSTRADLGAIVRQVRWRVVYSTFEADWRYWRLARRLHARDYRRMIAFGPAWFLHLDSAASIPELRVTERVFASDGEFIGPWPSQRAATQALEGLWDLFELCRYPEQVRRAPQGVRCAYFDMGRCDAPCDGSTPLERYRERNREAWKFASCEIGAWLIDAEQRMRAAAKETRFEAAALIKRQMQFATQWQSEWTPIVRGDKRLIAIALLPVSRRRAWTPFLFRTGELVDGPLMPDRAVALQAVEWARQTLAAPMSECVAAERMEQTWLFARLLYRAARDTTFLRWLDDEKLEGLEDEIRAHVTATRKRPEPPAAELQDAIGERDSGNSTVTDEPI